jgi:hypothetical protein
LSAASGNAQANNSTPAASTSKSGTFKPNENGSHEANESAQREAQETAGQFPTVP